MPPNPPSANPLIGTRALAVLEEKVAVLNGDRGDPEQAALRQAQLSALRSVLNKLIKTANTLQADLDQIQIDVEGAKTDLSTIQGQIDAINAAFPTIIADVAALTVRVTAIEVFTADIGTAAPGPTGASLIYHL